MRTPGSAESPAGGLDISTRQKKNPLAEGSPTIAMRHTAMHCVTLVHLTTSDVTPL